LFQAKLNLHVAAEHYEDVMRSAGGGKIIVDPVVLDQEGLGSGRISIIME
jgi:hypothetical protein